MSRRVMTPRLFSRAPIKTTPEAFLEEHWEWLQHRDRHFVSPLLKAYERKEITAQATIGALKEALLVHDIRQNIAKGEHRLLVAIEKQKEAAKYDITIYTKFFNPASNQWDVQIGTQTRKFKVDDGAGRIQTIVEEEDLIFESNLFQQAQRICALRLADRADSVFGEIINKFDSPLITRMTRDEALGLVYPRQKGPFTRNTSSTNKPMKNYARAHNDHVIGPWSLKNY